MLFSDMNYGLGGTCETATSNGTSTDGDYHQYLNPYNLSNSRSHQQIRTYSNGFHDSLILNGHHQSDQIENEQQQQQLTEDDYESIAPDRPKLLMWGLTKSGKTSIIKLIFEKMTAGETLQLPETKTIQKHGSFEKQINNHFLLFSLELSCGVHVRFQIRDVPGPNAASLLDFDTYSSECTTVIFVLDATVEKRKIEMFCVRF